LVIKALDPDWIRIRIGVHPKMLEGKNAGKDPDTCLKNSSDAEIFGLQLIFSLFLL
jgi:hypothetical protein